MQNNTVYAQPSGGGALKNSNVSNQSGMYGVSQKPSGGYSGQVGNSGVYQPPKQSPSPPINSVSLVRNQIKQFLFFEIVSASCVVAPSFEQGHL